MRRGITKRGSGLARGVAWCGDPATWRFMLLVYFPVLGAFHLLWEIIQLPLYTLWNEESPAYIAYAIVHCTAGDLLIGGSALLAALITTRAKALRNWRWIRLGAATTAFGVVYTAYSEWMNALVQSNWTYSEWMPVMPFVPIGLSPLLQWIVIPPAALIVSRRLVLSRPSRTEPNRAAGDEQ